VLVGAFLFWPETRQHVPEPTSPLVADTTPAQSRQPDSATQRDPSLVAPTTYFGFQVERPAAPSAGNPTPSYPEPLRSANLEGEVLAQFVVDTNGRADTSTFRILRQTNALFGTSVRAVLPRLRFTAAMISGRKVRQLVQQAFNFNITESGRITDSARVNAPGRRIVADPPRFLNSRLPLGPGDTVLFEDDFSTTRPELVHGPESVGCESRYLNGQIVLKNTKPGLSCHNAFNIPGRLGAPVRIEVSVQPLGGPRNRYFGFDFAVPGGEGVGAYRFVISDSGWAKLSMRGGMTSDDPMLVEQRSPVLRHGIGASNWLAVEIRGRTIRTFVNGRSALTPYESPVDLVGWLAFYLSSTDMEVAFDNVRITRLGRE
jgi:TonB family protein